MSEKVNTSWLFRQTELGYSGSDKVACAIAPECGFQNVLPLCRRQLTFYGENTRGLEGELGHGTDSFSSVHCAAAAFWKRMFLLH